jgi:hypothetical protein
MKTKATLAMVSGLAALALAATCGPALAFGHHGHGQRHGGEKFGLYAHAAGITGDQIRTAFKNDPALKSDFETVKADKKAVDACIISGASCTSQIQAYAAAQSALTTEKLTDWQNLFVANGTTKDAAAVTLKSSLDSLNQQKHQLLHQAFSSAKGSDSMTPPATQQ